MSEKPSVSAADLSPETRRRLGIKRPRAAPAMTKNEVRGDAIRVLAEIANLSPSERARVLRHALLMNDV